LVIFHQRQQSFPLLFFPMYLVPAGIRHSAGGSGSAALAGAAIIVTARIEPIAISLRIAPPFVE